MFRAHSPYSPFFTSGLLSEPLHRLQDGHQPSVYLDVVFSDDDHYRSFLSLDLAESLSSRSHSLRHTHSYRRQRMSKSTSRSSLRPIPSPKPIPSSTLPPLPSHFARSSSVPTSPPRLPSLPILPSLELDVSPRRSVSSRKRYTSFYPATRQPSVASTHTRLRNRADALALLEGRHRPSASPLARPSQQPENFMSMSDDEDEDDDREDKSLIQPLSDQEDEVVDSFDPSYEPEDIVLPAPSPHSFLPSGVVRNKYRKHASHKLRQRRTKHRSARARDRFPLKSFIDFCNENDDDAASINWNWRSFIEFSTVS